jgi:hypothetical protein
LRQTEQQYRKPLVVPFFFPALDHRATRQVELLAGRACQAGLGACSDARLISPARRWQSWS